MNILVIAPFFPYPLTQGGKITVFNTLKYLSREHRVSFACVTDVPVTDYGPLKEYCEELVVVERKANVVRDLLSLLFGEYPFNAVRLHSEEFVAQLRSLLQRQRFDLVQIEFSLMWCYAPLFEGIPCTLDAHNIEHEIISQNRLNCRNPLKRFLYSVEERKLKALEERSWRECSLCFTVSENEKKAIATVLGDDSKLITMVGVDLSRFEFLPKNEPGKRILFVGGLSYLPNLDSARYLLQEVFPRIHARDPGVTLDMVGTELWRVDGIYNGSEGVEIHENVPEILPWFRGADLLIIPLRLGAGIRIKILEAMSAGLPMVATAKGCEGLAVEHGRELLIADDADRLADEVLRLLDDQELRMTLAENARRFVSKHYSWETLVRRMSNGFRRVVESYPVDGSGN